MNLQARVRAHPDFVAAFALGAAFVALYAATNWGRPTPYDYFGRLAQALMEGRYWLDESPEWLNELVPCGPQKYCVPYLPGPVAFVLPFVSFLAPDVAQTTASAVAGGLSAGVTYLAVRGLEAPRRLALATTLLASAGTTLWLSAADGRTWYFAHAVAVLFATLAAAAALWRRPPLLVGVLLGVAAITRGSLLLAAPGLTLLCARRRGEGLIGTLVWLGAGIAPFVAIELAYNLLRWGVPWESGYLRLTQDNALLGSGGQFSLSSIPDHLQAMFLMLPESCDGAPLPLCPSPLGMSILLVSPALVFAAGAWWGRSRPEVLPLALAAAMTLVPAFLHTSTGNSQFGYRFSLDAQPFLLPLVAIGVAWRARWIPPPPAFGVLVGLSILSCAYGVLVITLLGIVII